MIHDHNHAISDHLRLLFNSPLPLNQLWTVPSTSVSSLESIFSFTYNNSTCMHKLLLMRP